MAEMLVFRQEQASPPSLPSHRAKCGGRQEAGKARNKGTKVSEHLVRESLVGEKLVDEQLVDEQLVLRRRS